MKKIVAAMLGLAMMASLMAGCGGSTEQGGQQAGQAEGTVNFMTEKAEQMPKIEGLAGQKDGKPVRIGFTISVNDQYGSLMSTAFLDKAKEYGADAKLVEAKENDTTMLNQVQQFAAEGVDVIVVQMTNTKIPQQVVDAAKGIPVIFLNRPPVGDIKGAAYYVGSDDHQAGLMQGEALAKFFEKEGKKEINLVQFQGELGLQNTNARTAGVQEALEAAGIKVTKVYEDTAKWQRTNATNQMQTFLGTGKEFDAVAANNDEMAIGAILAMESKNVDFSKIPVVGVDATKDGVIAVEEGKMYATVFQDANGQGAGALELCLALVHGKSVPKNIDIPFQLVTKENVANFK